MADVEVCGVEMFELSKLVGERRAREISEQFDKLIKDQNLSDSKGILKAVSEELEVRKRKAFSNQKERLATVKAYSELYTQLIDGKPPKEMFKNLERLTDNIANRQASVRDAGHAMMDNLMPYAELLRDDNFQKNIFKYIRSGNAEGMSKEVLEAAKVFKKTYNKMLSMKQAAGLDIGELSNYAGARYHSKYKINEAPERWDNVMKSSLDFNAMGIAPDKVDGYMNGLYKKLEEKVNIYDDEFIDFSVGAQKSVMESQNLIFKSPELEYEYIKEFGRGNLLDNTFATIDTDARNIGLSSVLGPRNDLTFNKLLGNFETFAKKEETAIFDKQRLKRNYDHIKGSLSFQQSPRAETTVGKLAAFVRQIIDAAKLSIASFLSTGTDIPIAAGFINTIANGSPSGFVMNNIKIGHNVMKNFASKEAANEVAVRLGVYASETSSLRGSQELTSVMERVKGFKSTDRIHNLLMKLTGLPRQDMAAKTAISKQMSGVLASLSESSMDNLAANQQRLLKDNLISKEMWENIRLNAKESIGDFDILSPMKLFEMGMDKEGLALQTLLRKVARTGSPTSNVTLEAIKNSFSPDSWQGIVTRSMLQFKSFPISVMETMKSVSRYSNGHFDRVFNLSSIAATGTIVGSMVYSARKYARDGKLPDINTTDGRIKLLAEGFAMGGGAGLLGDIFSRDYSQSHTQIAEDILGPSAGLLADVSEIAAAKIRGKDLSKNQLSRFFHYNTPSILYAPATYKYTQKAFEAFGGYLK